VTGGGLSLDGTSWISCRPGFLLSVRVLSHLFRRLFLEALEVAFSLGKLYFYGDLAACRDGFPPLLTELGDLEWVVYAKPPFGGAQQVIDYLGRYTHRVAISNQRLRDIDNDHVVFDYKDYRSGDRYKSRHMTLSADEFIRRFLLHTLPAGFQRIRHYGLLASRNKQQNLLLCRTLLEVASDLLPSPAQIAECVRELLSPAGLCPMCRARQMIRIEILPPSRCIQGVDSS
jgi:Putative transposase